jgi:hypothetical protein
MVFKQSIFHSTHKNSGLGTEICFIIELQTFSDNIKPRAKKKLYVHSVPEIWHICSEEINSAKQTSSDKVKSKLWPKICPHLLLSSLPPPLFFFRVYLGYNF